MQKKRLETHLAYRASRSCELSQPAFLLKTTAVNRQQTCDMRLVFALDVFYFIESAAIPAARRAVLSFARVLTLFASLEAMDQLRHS